MKFFLGALVLFFIVGAFVAYKEIGAAPVTLIPRDVLFANPQRSFVRLSPSGEYISFGSSFKGVQNIYIAKVKSPGDVTPITKDEGRGIRKYFWARDNAHIIYLKDDGGDENWRIHVVNIQSFQDRVLTPEKVRASIYHVSDKMPEEIVIGLNDRDSKYHDVYRLNIVTGQKTLILKNTKQFKEFIVDDNYRLRFASISKADGGTQYFKAIFNETLTEYDWESFIEYGMADAYTTDLLGLTKDGNILYFKDSRGQDLNALKEVNLLDNSQRVLAQGRNAEIGDIMTDPRTGIVQAYSIDYLRNEWFCLESGFEVHLNNIKKSISGEFSIISRTSCDSIWIVAHMRDDGPIGYYIYTKADQKLIFLFNNSDVLNKYRLARMEGVVIKARDGLDMPCYLTKTLCCSEKPPLVVLVHGGPWARDSWGYSSVVQLLANRGFSVLQINFRGSTGFGKAFVAKGNLEWGRKMHEDILDGVQWAIREGIVDPTKIGICGGSYGGYESLWAATQSGDVFTCAVDIVGPSNLETLLSTFPPYWASFMEMAYRQVGDPRTKDGRALLKDRSPLIYVDKIKIPVLIAQGENDPRVKMAESEQIVAAMKEKGLPYIYMLFTDEGHGFARPENNIAFYAIAERFLSDNLGGRYEPLNNALKKSTLDPTQKRELEARFK
jgi:dipeptidyl aminopeptidase/acylaminoacyl peptidase